MSEKTALILVDIQNDFLEGGSLAVPDSLSIIEPVNELIRYIKSKNGFVVATQDWHPQNHVSFASNHKNKNVFDQVQIEYEVVGLAADYCVKFTCLDAIKFGFKTVLIKEGTKAVDQNNLTSTFELLKSKGVLIHSLSDVFNH
ncbi:hypothetical protein RO3G_09883 [Rhizopus delemar RA 99-880]|uniref:nicotinamidase n=1 Tax=Rhizopus delemar (strain RA 99-880 / ATCC MYA-4621 / FGSC 9543 / NRRL 43880) TaxID=246409 RepID=I1C9P3_RHIO9|nr:hypothetical protein RO3G_09883 [Rhizopus delemar RA 99-880]|eukprot:EIE85173.1 hypothetical protein RO3G_09883 [Rhizopus delemar RA 99-880]